jgi:chemotaxis protein MotA
MAEEAAKPAPKPGAKPGSKAGSKPDFATIGGVLLALGGIVGGLLLEGGKISDIAQFTAALIVVGGTLGAVMVNTPLNVLLGAAKRITSIVLGKSQGLGATIDEIIEYALKARKSGLVSLEQEALQVQDPFLRKALNLAVDGTDLQELRKMMELEIAIEQQRGMAEAKVFESAGGYAPTIGIIGAVMGLIQVMKNLANIDEVGHGIAVAFVATVYGVALSNLFLLPAANKMKARISEQLEVKELMLEGVAGIIEGLNPKLIRSKLEAYHPPTPGKPAKGGKTPEAAANAAAAGA